MKKCSLIATLAAIFASSAQGSEIVKDAFVSPTLGREINMHVYLPDIYETDEQPLPVIYMLHGANSDDKSWVERGGIKVSADALIARGHMRPSIIVMPTLGPESWYVDGNAEKTETAFIHDLLPYIEEKYKTRADRAGRAIGGLSMGGYGALNLSLSYPEQFCAAAVLSPAIYDPFPPETSASRKTPQFTKEGRFDEGAWTQALYPARLENYYTQKTIVPMWIESGDHDYLGIALAAAKLYWTLYQSQPQDVEYRVIDGDHDWMVFRESSLRALPYISAKCEALGK